MTEETKDDATTSMEWRDDIQQFVRKELEEPPIDEEIDDPTALMVWRYDLQRFVSPMEEEEDDATTLMKWRLAFERRSIFRCPDEVTEYLDTNLAGWRDKDPDPRSDEHNSRAMELAKSIVERALLRQERGENLLPRRLTEEAYPELLNLVLNMRVNEDLNTT